jgi:hypothetical protein
MHTQRIDSDLPDGGRAGRSPPQASAGDSDAQLLVGAAGEQQQPVDAAANNDDNVNDDDSDVDFAAYNHGDEDDEDDEDAAAAELPVNDARARRHWPMEGNVRSITIPFWRFYSTSC